MMIHDLNHQQTQGGGSWRHPMVSDVVLPYSVAVVIPRLSGHWDRGKLPEWYVDHLWLQSQFGVRPNQTSPEQPQDTDQDASSPPSNEIYLNVTDDHIVQEYEQKW